LEITLRLQTHLRRRHRDRRRANVVVREVGQELESLLEPERLAVRGEWHQEEPSRHHLVVALTPRGDAAAAFAQLLALAPGHVLSDGGKAFHWHREDGAALFLHPQVTAADGGLEP
jgi:hypothetical protein